jgi:hypothetical protein
MGDKLSGLAVHIGARVAAAAVPTRSGSPRPSRTSLRVRPPVRRPRSPRPQGRPGRVAAARGGAIGAEPTSAGPAPERRAEWPPRAPD